LIHRLPSCNPALLEFFNRAQGEPERLPLLTAIQQLRVRDQDVDRTGERPAELGENRGDLWIPSHMRLVSPLIPRYTVLVDPGHSHRVEYALQAGKGYVSRLLLGRLRALLGIRQAC